MTCIFCDILDGKRDGHILYEDDLHVSFLDRYPIDVGHSLVIPREHHERITEMTPENVGKLFSLVPKIAKAILTGAQADAFSMLKIIVVLQNRLFHTCIFTSYLDTTVKEQFGLNDKFQLILNLKN